MQNMSTDLLINGTQHCSVKKMYCSSQCLLKGTIKGNNRREQLKGTNLHIVPLQKLLF